MFAIFPSVLEEAQRRFSQYSEKNDESIIPGDLRTAIFSAAVRTGGENEYEKVLSVYRRPPTPQHKSACIRALTNAPTEALRKRTLDMILSDEVKTQDVVSLPSIWSSRPYLSESVIDVVRSRRIQLRSCSSCHVGLFPEQLSSIRNSLQRKL